jgi:hypothetical protein
VRDSIYQFYRFASLAGAVEFTTDIPMSTGEINEDSHISMYEFTRSHLIDLGLTNSRRRVEKHKDYHFDKWWAWHRSEAKEIRENELRNDLDGRVTLWDNRVNALDQIDESIKEMLALERRYDNANEILLALTGGDEPATDTSSLAEQINNALESQNIDLASLLSRYGLLEDNDNADDVFENLLEKHGDEIGEDNQVWMENICTSSEILLNDKLNDLNDHLYSSDRDNYGIAVEQSILLDNAETIAEDFLKSGHLELLNGQLLNNSLSGSELSAAGNKLEDKAEWLCQSLRSDIEDWRIGTDDGRHDLFIGVLEELLQNPYIGVVRNGEFVSVSKEVNIGKIRNALDIYYSNGEEDYLAIAADALEEYVAGAELGIEYKNAFNEAYSNPGFQGCNHLLRMTEDHLTLMSQLIDDDLVLLSSQETQQLTETFKLLAAGISGVTTATKDYSLTDYRDNGYLEVRLDILKNMQRDLQQRKLLWNNQMDAIQIRGEVAWRDSLDELNEQYDLWTKEYADQYLEQQAQWIDGHQEFIEGKSRWVADLAKQATEIGNREILRNMDQDTQDRIDDLTQFTIDDFLIEEVDVAFQVSNVIDSTLLSDLLKGARQQNAQIGQTDQQQLYMSAGGSYLTSDEMLAINDYQQNNNDELKSHMAILQFEKMLDQLEASQDQLVDQVHSSNQGFSASMDKTLSTTGYRLQGNRYAM